MKLYLTKTIQVPKDMTAVTRIGSNEVAPEQAGMTQSQVQRIWGAMEKLYLTGNHPMLSICLRKHGQIVLNRSMGHARGNSPTDSPQTPKVIATPDTPLCLFSASKTFTAVLVHILNERGLIDLLDPVSYYIPEYAAQGKQDTTILHLLTHRGGIPHLVNETDHELLFDHQAVIKKICAAEAVAPSGHRLAYHAITAGYILGELIERVTGQTVKTFLQENISIPMDLPYLDYGLAEEYRPLVAHSSITGLNPALGSDVFFKRMLGGDLQMIVDVTNDTRFMDAICPAGNIYTTAEQSGRFFEMLLNGGSYNGKKILDAKTVRRATIENSRATFDRTLGVPMRYSAGFQLGGSPLGLYGPATRHAFGHLGLSNNFCWADPERDISVSILSSGKSIVGSHLPALVALLCQISSNCNPVMSTERRAVFRAHSVDQFAMS
jgi:CubicO group peptidase (beta-lactamase class C family)